MQSIIVSFFGLILGTILSVITMIYGWGVSPKSWLVILGVGLFSQFFLQVLVALGMKK